MVDNAKDSLRIFNELRIGTVVAKSGMRQLTTSTCVTYVQQDILIRILEYCYFGY